MSGQRGYESAARGLKRVTLELGGKSPNIVFDDAVIEDAVKGAISGIFAGHAVAMAYARLAYALPLSSMMSVRAWGNPAFP
jgi:hypothetical protein